MVKVGLAVILFISTNVSALCNFSQKPKSFTVTAPYQHWQPSSNPNKTMVKPDVYSCNKNDKPPFCIEYVGNVYDGGSGWQAPQQLLHGFVLKVDEDGKLLGVNKLSLAPPGKGVLPENVSSVHNEIRRKELLAFMNSLP